VRSTRLRTARNDLVSVDVGSIENCYQAGVKLKMDSYVGEGVSLPESFCHATGTGTSPGPTIYISISYINKMSCNRCRRSHRRTDQMRAPANALPAFKVAIAG